VTAVTPERDTSWRSSRHRVRLDLVPDLGLFLLVLALGLAVALVAALV
jgi:hypothetical protein